jgi:transposase-like protein
MDGAGAGQAAALDDGHGDGVSLPDADGAAIPAAICRLLAAAADWSPDGQPSCPRCRGARSHRWGRVSETNVQRWRCCDCGRSFTARTGTLAAGLHAPHKLPLVIRDMFAAVPSSCRRLAAATGLDKMTVWSWRSRISRMLSAAEAAHDTPLALGTLGSRIVRESRKASREWVNHRLDPARFPQPDRLRWIDYASRRQPLPRPMTPYLVPIQLGLDPAGAVRASVVLPAALCHGDAGHPFPATGSGSGHVMQGDPALGEDHPPQMIRFGSRAFAAAHRERIERLVDALGHFLRPFRGPATRHLGGYASWFAARQGYIGCRAGGHAAMAPPR